MPKERGRGGGTSATSKKKDTSDINWHSSKIEEITTAFSEKTGVKIDEKVLKGALPFTTKHFLHGVYDVIQDEAFRGIENEIDNITVINDTDSSFITQWDAKNNEISLLISSSQLGNTAFNRGAGAHELQHTLWYAIGRKIINDEGIISARLRKIELNARIEKLISESFNEAVKRAESLIGGKGSGFTTPKEWATQISSYASSYKDVSLLMEETMSEALAIYYSTKNGLSFSNTTTQNSNITQAFVNSVYEVLKERWKKYRGN